MVMIYTRMLLVRKFLTEIILVLCIATIVAMIIVFSFYRYIPNQYETNYISSMWDKYCRLMSIEEPKIVLVGDSNLAFGIDSEYIESELGMPVVNMGLHGGLGNDIQTRIAMSNIRSGDIYVIAYSDYSQTQDVSQKDLTLIMLANHEKLWDTISLKQKTELIPAIPNYMFDTMSYFLRKRGNEDVPYENSDYSRKGFNEYGDNTIRIEGNEIKDFSQFKSLAPSISKETEKMIRRYKKICDDKRAQMVISCYPILVTQEMDDTAKYYQSYNDIERCTGVSVISDINDYMMPKDMFYDSQLHLNMFGVKKRSDILLEELKEIMSD